MLSLFFTLGLLLVSPEEHAAPKEAVHTEVAKKEASHKEAKSKAEKEGEAAKSEAPEAAAKAESRAEPKAEPKAEARPVPRRRPSPSPAAALLVQAEARATRLLEENARIQQEMAKVTGATSAPITTPDAALTELRAGNGRFVMGKRVRSLLSMQDSELRAMLAKGQAPFAVIVTCSDSRLADNLIFDQELGRLFTIREAGNSPDTQGIASVEYAVEHLGSRLVVVLGHTACGAVKAVAEAHGKPLPGNLWSLQAAMAGLLESTPEDPNELTTDYYKRLSAHNAQRQAQALLDRSEILRELVGKGKLRIVPASYDLASGEVKFLEMPKAEAPHEGH